MTVTRIVSGGQTGADRGGLDAALALGIECGGWCPRGRRAEDGPVPARYRLRETESADYAVRTERNVTDSDGTLLVTRGAPSGGSALTAQVARRHRKALLAVDLAATSVDEAVERVRAWVAREQIETLNVAGSRASKAPGLDVEVAALLTRALSGAGGGARDAETPGHDV